MPVIIAIIHIIRIMYHTYYTQYLDTADYEIKTARKVRRRVEIAAAGGYMKGSGGKWIVRWDADGRNVRAGPGIIAIVLIILIIPVICIIFIFLFRSKILRITAKKCGCSFVLQRILADPSLLHQFDVHARYHASD